VLKIPYIWDAVNGARTLAVPNAKGLSRINNLGVAIGWVNGNVLNDAFFADIETGAYTMLNDVFPSNFGFGPTRAFDINDSGAVVGTRFGTTPVVYYGYVYSPSSGLQILPFPGAGYQQAVRPLGINNPGTVVGEISTVLGSSRAFVYSTTDGIQDLNNTSLVTGAPPGYRLASAQKINDLGWIVGLGRTAAGKSTAFVLKPHNVAGDIDGDGLVNMTDLELFIGVLLGTNNGAVYFDRSEMNGDGIVNGDDVQPFVHAIVR